MGFSFSIFGGVQGVCSSEHAAQKAKATKALKIPMQFITLKIMHLYSSMIASSCENFDYYTVNLNSCFHDTCVGILFWCALNGTSLLFII